MSEGNENEIENESGDTKHSLSQSDSGQSSPSPVAKVSLVLSVISVIMAVPSFVLVFLVYPDAVLSLIMDIATFLVVSIGMFFAFLYVLILRPQQ